MIKQLIYSRFSASLAYYSFVPFFAVYLVKSKGVDEGQTALIVSLLIFSGRFFTLMSGYITGLMSCKKLLLTCYSLCIITLVTIVFTKNALVLTVSGLVIGICFALCSIVSKVLVASASTSDTMRFFGYLNLAVNIASALGTVLADQTAKVAINLLPLASAAILFLTIYSVVKIKIDDRITSTMKITLSSVTQIITYKNGGFLLISTTPWIIYGYFFNSIAYQLTQPSVNGEYNVSLLFSLNAGIIITLQTVVMHFVSRIKKERILWLSCFNQIILCSAIFFLQPGGYYFLIIFVVLFSLSELIWSPLNDYLSAEIVAPESRSIFMPVCNFTWGLAETAGTYVGINYFSVINQYVIFIIPVICLFVLIAHLSILSPYDKWLSQKESEKYQINDEGSL
jgi:predicted MFS family arabinose efflux permease